MVIGYFANSRTVIKGQASAPVGSFIQNVKLTKMSTNPAKISVAESTNPKKMKHSTADSDIFNFAAAYSSAPN